MPFRTAPKSFAPAAAGKPGAPSGIQPTPQSQWPADADPLWTFIGVAAGALRSFEDLLTGFVSFPGLANYEQARAGEASWPTPVVIAYSFNLSDVRQCLEFAENNQLAMSVRSGGHNSAGYHLCNGLVIDVSAIDQIQIDTSTGIVTVGPGTTFAQLDQALTSSDLALPEGTCSNVCCAGYFMGGGYSLASRTFGMGCDSLLSAQVVNAAGGVVTASADQDQELLWALRGGGGGQFGVVIEMTLQGHGPNSFWGFVAEWPLDLAVEVLGVLEEQYTISSSPTPEPFGYLCVLSYLVAGDPVHNGGKGPLEPEPSLAVLGMYHGTEAQGRSELADLLAIGPATIRYSTQAPFSVINNDLFLFLPYVALGLDTVPSISASGLVGPDQHPDWSALVSLFGAGTNRANLIAFEPYGGAIASTDPTTASFPHRSQKLDMLVDSFWSESWTGTKTRAQATAWLDDVLGVLAPCLSGRTYVNYADRGLRDYRTQYWAQSFDRLLAKKQLVDQTNAFGFDQSITWAPPLPE